MSFFSQALALISEAPGSLAYHLLALFSLEAALLFALSRHGSGWARGPGSRLALAAGCALAVRFGLVALAGLGSAGRVFLPGLQPPLERAGLLITIMIMGWALISQPRSALAGLLLTLGIAGVAVGLTAALPVWQALAASGAAYNNTRPDQIWQAAQLLTLLLLLIMLVAVHPPDWGTGVGMFAVLAAASGWHLLQSLQPQPLLAGSVPGLTRLAELVALPMFALTVQRRVLQAAIRQAELSSSSFAPLLQAPSTALSPAVARALGSMGTGTDRTTTIYAVCEAAALALQADGAVLWEAARANPGSTRCSGGFYVPTQHTIERFTVAVNGVSATVAALMEGRACRLQARSHAAELAALSKLLDLPDVRTALLAPLPDDGHTVRALMVYAPRSMQNWRDGDDELLKALAAPAAEALADSEDYQRMLESMVAPAQKSQALPHWLAGPGEESPAPDQAAGLLAQVQRLEYERSELSKQLAAARKVAAVTPEPTTPLADDERAQLHAQVAGLQTALDETHALLAGQQPEAADLWEQLGAARSALAQLTSEQALVAGGSDLAEASTQLALLSAERALLTASNATKDQDLAAARAQLAEQATALAAQTAAAEAGHMQLTAQAAALQAELQAASIAASTTLQQSEAHAADAKAVAATAQHDSAALRAEFGGSAARRSRTPSRQRTANSSTASRATNSCRTTRTAQTAHQAQVAALQATHQTLADQHNAEQAASGQALASAALEVQQLQAALLAAQTQPAAAGADAASEVAAALSSISDYSELMLDGAGGKIDVLQRKFLERIKCAAMRADALLDAHNRCAALQAGHALKLQRMALPALLLAAAAWARLQFADRAISFESTFSAELPEVLADAGALSAALHMLLLGAGFAGQPGRHVWFSVTVLPAAPSAEPLLQFEVRDANAPAAADSDEPGRAELNPGLLQTATTLIEGLAGRLVATPASGGGTLVMALLPAAPAD
ncbi:hypothetical protein EMGBD1_10510 [Anaerolineaceae bacterium]|nr:hypothetical protein EMGBD1_10510 [Anaerolineaceae bacterium]